MKKFLEKISRSGADVSAETNIPDGMNSTVNNTGIGESRIAERCPFAEELVKCALALPLAVSSAHSTRFGNHENSIGMLERIMIGCNKMIVYLEQAKGVCGNKIDLELADDLIRRYGEARIKIFRLEKSWQKWYEPRK